MHFILNLKLKLKKKVNFSSKFSCKKKLKKDIKKKLKNTVNLKFVLVNRIFKNKEIFEKSVLKGQ